MLIPDFELFYEKTKITQDVKPYLLDLTYSDNLAGQSDELSVTFEDRDFKWINGWFPTQGDELSLLLGYQGMGLVNLGAFEIDEIEFSYGSGGSVVSIKALSTGLSKASRTLTPKAYEKTTLANIVRMVANKLKLSVTGEIRHIELERVTQYQERDVEFLTRLASEYHHSFKIVDKTLVFTTIDSLKEQEAVAVLDLSQTLSIRLKDRIKDTAKSVEVTGFNPKSKKAIKAKKDSTNKRKSKTTKATKTTSKANKEPKRTDTLKVITRGESQAQIDAKATSAVNAQDDEQQSGSITLVGNPKLVAGNTLMLQGFGVFSGKYLIKSARHTLGRMGYLTDIEIRMLTFIADNAITEQSL